jgi:peptidoglycan/xylan/chitin deacetylase (PgdA/CDA1 family)
MIKAWGSRHPAACCCASGRSRWTVRSNADAVDRILTTLTREQVPATMFLTGDFVRRFTGEADAIVAAGERIGNHSIPYPYSSTRADTELRAEVLGAQADTVQATGEAQRHGFASLTGTKTWKGALAGITVHSIVERALTHLQAGVIVLMHCGSNPADHSTLTPTPSQPLFKMYRNGATHS